MQEQILAGDVGQPNVADNGVAVDVTKQISRVLTSFESIVRRFPTSGYADNALWEAAKGK